MWWNHYEPAQWMFFGPMMTLVLMICTMGMFFMMRMGPMRHFGDQTGLARTGIAPGSRG